MAKRALKYENLERARKAGCLVPPTLYLSESDIKTDNLSGLNEFVLNHPAQNYIVRSAVSAEDMVEKANAGFFFSSDAAGKDELPTTVKSAYAENRKRAPENATVDLMVSPYIKSQRGGVVFSPWLYFFAHSFVEYANSPQKAVLGSDVKADILGQEGLLSGHFESFEKQLWTQIELIKKGFNFPVDMEWAYDGSEVQVLQVRPVTIAPQSITTRKLELPNCVYDEYGRAFGKLSPLSFELLNYCFANATWYWNRLRIKGGADFLQRHDSGIIFTDTKKHQRYFANQHWYDSFRRALNTFKIEKELTNQAKTWRAPENFSLEKSVEAFSGWQTAQALERLVRKEHTTEAIPFEYELGQKLSLGKYNKTSLANTWKKHFLESTQPLRKEVENNPRLLWSKLVDAVADKVSPDWQTRYQQELQESIYAPKIEGDGRQKLTVLTRAVSGRALVVENPDAYHASLPKDSVVVTSHIPPHWIRELPHLTGIVVSEIGQLSHAAIVLRENEVPAVVISEEKLKKIKTGDDLAL